jgi:hypothetical protein
VNDSFTTTHRDAGRAVGDLRLRAVPFKAGYKMTMRPSDDGINYKANFRESCASERVGGRHPGIGELSASRIKHSLYRDDNN